MFISVDWERFRRMFLRSTRSIVNEAMEILGNPITLRVELIWRLDDSGANRLDCYYKNFHYQYPKKLLNLCKFTVIYLRN